MIKNTIYWFIIFFTFSCNKTTPEMTEVVFNKLINKSWNMDYLKKNNLIYNYSSKPTYIITFLKSYSLNDSDGIIGNFTILKYSEEYQLLINGKTINGSEITSKSTIEFISDSKLILTHIDSKSNTKISQYFSVR